MSFIWDRKLLSCALKPNPKFTLGYKHFWSIAFLGAENVSERQHNIEPIFKVMISEMQSHEGQNAVFNLKGSAWVIFDPCTSTHVTNMKRPAKDGYATFPLRRLSLYYSLQSLPSPLQAKDRKRKQTQELEGPTIHDQAKLLRKRPRTTIISLVVVIGRASKYSLYSSSTTLLAYWHINDWLCQRRISRV